ncbi:superoxide dismutase [Microdochium trichocladiopsis]|uniref:superoxide dismutase n=1 Tax=Microdochium trichocladiopsis TaxID=1682393 RepID=A0A9P8Y6V0_9PEZI|nr:superoxide dismutase [Microdochium trichocladiopsis]KAH7031359.1 superoxide dismutase [Microdochium trichocladiopsis]
MRFSQISALALVGAAGAFAQEYIPADVVSGNPEGVNYVATLPVQPFFKAGSLNGNVKGSVSAKAGPGGVGVQFDVQFSNLPTEGGPFIYHLHVAPVPSGGNCTATLAHVDPFKRGEEPPCDPSTPALCQTGDLSGKFGKITSDPFTASYVDPYSSITEDVGGSFLGNRSFVFHFANKTRITCADFHLAPSQPNTTVYPTGSALPTVVPPTTVPIAAGNSLVATLGAVVAVVPVLAWTLFI